MALQLTADTTISEISVSEFNVREINRIGEDHGAIRQKSKAPT